MSRTKVLVVGAGITGCILTYELANDGRFQVTLCDKANHIGGLLYDKHHTNTGILLSKYGPHIFKTDSEMLWNYLSRFTTFLPFVLKSASLVESQLISLPLNINDIYKILPKHEAEEMIKLFRYKLNYGETYSINELIRYIPENDFLAEYIKYKMIRPYNKKLLDTDSFIDYDRKVFRFNMDSNRYIQKYQGIPYNSWTETVNNILHKADKDNFELYLNRHHSTFDESKFDIVLFTGSPDDYYDYAEGSLNYRTLHYEHIELDRDSYQSHPIIHHPRLNEFTRSIEYKKFLKPRTNKTVLTLERSANVIDNKTDVLSIPLRDVTNGKRLNKYLDMASKQNQDKTKPKVYFAGRLGKYKPMGIDTAIVDALHYVDVARMRIKED